MSTTQLETISALRRDIVVRWLVPDRIIFATGVGSLSPTVRDWINARVTFLMHSCSTPHIHLIFDVRRMVDIPLRGLISPSLRHPRRGWFITVGPSAHPTMPYVLRFLARVLILNYRTCSTLDEALSLLGKIDPTLPDLQSYCSALTLEQQP